MKRLENILPHLKHGQFDSKFSTFTVGDTNHTLSLSPLSFSFLQLCNGSYSVKEICMLVYGRETNFSFVEIYFNLEKWASEEVFRNSQDILESIHHTSALFAPPANGPEPKVFSAMELLLALRKVSMFSNFSEASIKHIVAISTQQTFRKEEVIVRRGSPATEAFVLLTGAVGVFKTPYVAGIQPVAILPPLTVFGESAAFPNQKRTADVVAVVPSQILRIQLQKLTDPALNNDLNKSIRLRLIFSQMIKTHHLFKNMPSDVIQRLLSGCRVEKVPAGTTVIEQGDSGQDFYFILAGNVGIFKDDKHQVSLSAGNYFGEMGGLLKQTRSATVTAETECVFLVLGVKNFISILASNLPLAMEIEKIVHQRRDKTPMGIEDTVESPMPEDFTVTEDITREMSESILRLESFDFSQPSGE